jgi:hypothetical protein
VVRYFSWFLLKNECGGIEMAEKDVKKEVKKEKKQSFWEKRISTPVGLIILFVELAIVIGIGLLICLA